MTFADVKAVVVLAIHKIGVIDLKGELLKVVRQGKNVKFRLREKSDILVDQGERVKTEQTKEGAFRDGRHVKNEGGFSSIEDVRELQLKQIGVFLGNEGGFVQGGSSLAFFEDGDQMFRF